MTVGELCLRHGLSFSTVNNFKPVRKNAAKALDISFSANGAKAAVDLALEVLYRSIIEQLNDLDKPLEGIKKLSIFFQ